MIIDYLQLNKQISRHDAAKLVELGEDSSKFSKLFLSKEFRDIKYYNDKKSGHIELREEAQKYKNRSNTRFCPECGNDWADTDYYTKITNELMAANREKPKEEQLPDHVLEKSLFKTTIEGNLSIVNCAYCKEKIKFCRLCKTLIEPKQHYCNKCNNITY